MKPFSEFSNEDWIEFNNQFHDDKGIELSLKEHFDVEAATLENKENV